MDRNVSNLCYSIKNSILDSFEEIGYLNEKDLISYINHCISIEITKSQLIIRNEIFNKIFTLITRNESYIEFKNGKTLMCSKCGLIKPVGKFNTYIHNNVKSRKTTCKRCEYENHRIWIGNNPKKQKEYDKKKYEKNKDKYKEKYAKWRINNPDTHRLYNRKYKARLHIKNKLNRELTNEEHNLINKLVQYENLTGMKILKAGVIK